MQETTWIAAAAVAGALLLAALYAWQRAAGERRARRELALATERGLHVPASLHPVIDPDLCIGSLSCIKACPEGDILGVVDGRAKLIHGANCVGHGKCAAECPVDAIKLVFGTSERGVDLPEVNEVFESSRPGVHVVGELGGMGLIRNAIRQGLEVSEHLAQALTPTPPVRAEPPPVRAEPPPVRAEPPPVRAEPVEAPGGIVDVAIVGAGPAGLSTAVGLRARGLSFRLLEQGQFGGAMAQYPRQKVVMTEPAVLPLYGKFGKPLISKEELLAQWRSVVRKADVRVEEGAKVTGLAGADGEFTVATSLGPVRARKVVLALGRRGSPRRLGVPGEDSENVSYSLVDPEQYAGRRVLVVGGGDSALEAAIQLADAGAEVALSYRGEALGRCREANRARFEALRGAGRIRALMPSAVKAIHPDRVELEHAGGPLRLPNDYVLVCIGGELPVELLGAMGVALKRHHGTAVAAAAHVEERAKPRQRRFDRWLSPGLFALGALIVAALIVAGWDYYRLPRLERLSSPLHDSLRPAGTWGHGVGIAATLFMLSNFLYSGRKRLRVLKGAGPIRRWLAFHVFVGFMSPLVIAFHAAFQSNNGLATATAGSLVIVVLTGLIGRFIYALVPTRDGRTIELADVAAQWERMKASVEPLLAGVTNAAPVRAMLAKATAPAPAGTLVGLFARLPFESLAQRWHLGRLRPLFATRAQHAEFRRAYIRLSRLRVQVGLYRRLKRLLSGWRVFHLVLALMLVGMIAAHVALSLYLGYTWIFA